MIKSWLKNDKKSYKNWSQKWDVHENLHLWPHQDELPICNESMTFSKAKTMVLKLFDAKFCTPKNECSKVPSLECEQKFAPKSPVENPFLFVVVFRVNSRLLWFWRSRIWRQNLNWTRLGDFEMHIRRRNLVDALLARDLSTVLSVTGLLL